MNHRHQIRKINAPWILKTNNHHRFVWCRYPPSDERVRRIDCWNALEIDISFGKLRTDELNIIRHTPKDGVGDRFSRIAASLLVAIKFLNPFQVDCRHHAILKIYLLCVVHRVLEEHPMKVFIVVQISIFG